MWKYEVTPLPGQQVSLTVDGIEKLRWHFNPTERVPFFFPLHGPANIPVTRMGHPGAPNHDHHRSIWFAHHKVNGVDFWSENGNGVIRQVQWYSYQDGDQAGMFSVLLHWVDKSTGQVLLQQDLIACLTIGSRGETLLELQSDFRTPLPSLTLEQTNFGLVAVRVAKSISGYFGTGKLTDSEERSTEAQIFGQRARWVDYSGQVSVGRGPNRQLIPQGVALMEHPSNQDFPKKWHVREDGWMGPSLCRDLPVVLEQNQTLRERSLIVAHDAQGDHNRLAILAQNFAESAPFVLEKSTLPHTSHQVVRAD